MKRREYLKDINQKQLEELKLELNRLSEELMKLRFKKAAGQNENPTIYRKTKKSIARIQTVINEKAASIA
jgi:large subunit ribosomal protein L29